MGKINSAVDWAVSIASDSSHGYAQDNRWGPDYDCSSLVISAWEKAGVPVKTKGATYTGNMKNVFLSCGFKDVTAQVNRSTGAGMKTGDVLLHEKNHTAMYIGAGKIVHASGNEKGGIKNGTPGDQTGGEICTRSYYNYPWDVILRYVETDTAEEKVPESGVYTVKDGDTLWGLAEEWLGTGLRYPEIMDYNNLKSDALSVGQVLKIPGSDEAETTVEKNDKNSGETITVALPVLRFGDTGKPVETMQVLLFGRGYGLPNYGIDGDFGEETEKALKQFQKGKGLAVDGVCGQDSWTALLK